ncbi:TIR domain-containing protein [Ohtaekwangia kribbensis]|uniref:TIR domain-containing protein n=1 Tax=Ohtaekwangia kribbensis TaxID=688913 RepID=A0ABW3K4C3_9BACT
MSIENKRKHLFISHHHKDDADVSKFIGLMQEKGYDIRNSSIRVKPENQERIDKKRVSDDVIRRLLRMKISWAGTTVVLIGKETHEREWVNWELEQSAKQGKRIVGVFLSGGSNADIPKAFEEYGAALVKWNSESIMRALEGENNFENPDGTTRDAPNRGTTGIC